MGEVILYNSYQFFWKTEKDVWKKYWMYWQKKV